MKAGLAPAADAAADDLVLPFHIAAADVHGRLARLGSGVDGILGAHDSPEAVASLLGELVVVGVATAGAFKFRGTLALQTSGDGPVPQMIAEYRVPEGGDTRVVPAALRGYARFDREKIAALADIDVAQAPVAQLLGRGHLAFTLDTVAGGERYQGVVSLDGPTLTSCVHGYFRQSAQLDAALRVDVGRVAGPNGGGPWAGRRSHDKPTAPVRRSPPGCGRRRLAEDVGTDGELWTGPSCWARRFHRATVLQRLFPEEDVRVYRPVRVESRCRCSRDRVDAVLHAFPPADLDDMVVDGEITVTLRILSSATSVFSRPNSRIPPPGRSDETCGPCGSSPDRSPGTRGLRDAGANRHSQSHLRASGTGAVRCRHRGDRRSVPSGVD